MPLLRLIPLVILLLLLPSCEEGGEDLPFLASCDIQDQNRFLHEVLLDRYLWYKEIEPVINYADFDSPAQLLDFLKYDEKDRFSYITDASDFQNLITAGQYLGYGFSYLARADDTVWIRFVYSDSPAGRAGLERGDEILAINGQAVADIISANAWPDIFGPAEQNYPLDLEIRKPGSSPTVLNLFKTTVNINTVLHASVRPQGINQVGYLVFKSFLGTSNVELESVFSQFKAASVNRLILDLRYNGGGSVSVARNLASYIIQDTTNPVFVSLEHNDRNPFYNSVYPFITLFHSLDLDQVIVITTGETCSASEMIVNGLDPYIDVKIVGSKTCGKPVGMNNFNFCDNALLPVTFASFNANGEGDYFNGFPADCAAEDNLSFAFGDEDEPMLKEALFVNANDACGIIRRPAQKHVSEYLPHYRSDSLQGLIGAI